MLRILHTVPCVVYRCTKKTYTTGIEPNPYAYNVYSAATWSPERGCKQGAGWRSADDAWPHPSRRRDRRPYSE